MSTFKRAVRREIIARERVFVARVISNPVLMDFDETADGSPVWVVDLDIGGNRPARNVPVKSDGSGGRFYAQLNQSVQVRRTALGRMYVVGPGDVAVATLSTTTYDLSTFVASGTADTGFTRSFAPFDYYQGDSSVTGVPNITFAIEAGDDSITRDAGSFITDGFAIGQTIEVMRTSLNDGQYTVTTVGALVLTVAEALLDEGPVSSIGIGAIATSRWNDGLTSFPFSQLIDADGIPI